jgi:hypothetical protein
MNISDGIQCWGVFFGSSAYKHACVDMETSEAQQRVLFLTHMSLVSQRWQRRPYAS